MLELPLAWDSPDPGVEITLSFSLFSLTYSSTQCNYRCNVSTIGGTAQSTTTTITQAPKPLDLTGTWVEKTTKSADMVQEATITGQTITVNWKQSDGTSALYWEGTYTPPISATDTYEWTSTGDKDKLVASLLASQDASKKFTYKDGKLTYEVTAMGVTATSELEKQ